MDETKRCRSCLKYKDARLDFYMCAGVYRTECKACSIKRNTRHQQKTKSWQNKYQDEEARREYMKKYRQKNADRFAKYREDFRDRHPEYYREYRQKKKELDD